MASYGIVELCGVREMECVLFVLDDLSWDFGLSYSIGLKKACLGCEEIVKIGCVLKVKQRRKNIRFL